MTGNDNGLDEIKEAMGSVRAELQKGANSSVGKTLEELVHNVDANREQTLAILELLQAKGMVDYQDERWKWTGG